MLSPQNLLYAAIGVTIGTLVGVLPGIGPALTIALLLPVALKLDDPTGTLIMFAGIYYGAMYGGSTTSILLNTPGESASVATVDRGLPDGPARPGPGRPRHRRDRLVRRRHHHDRAADVRRRSRWPRLAVTFRASDYFALAVLAMVAVTAVVGPSLVRGLMSLTFGLFLGLVGIDALTGQARFTFGVPSLLDGIDVVVVIVGLFAIGETLYIASRLRDLPAHVAPLEPGARVALAEPRRLVALVAAVAARHRAGLPVRCAALGRRRAADVPVVHVREAARRRTGDEFGRGAIEGVAGPEAANNASFSGVLVPLLTLGIPTSATAAVMLAAFSYFDISPGPQLLENQSDAGVGADRVAVRRQRDAAGAEPAADPAVGEGAADPAAGCSTPASSCSPPSASTRSPATSWTC